ncbi:glutamyl-tRNA synthetase/nondiscriminating glutamyl-tRNA synthetase [Abditibacterium utsteinense]|uniref:Glutamate--tRNA ligase n=1 Tax=Abditibacterium utsteinense TaxID=1960156 RepID=A0A2S8SSA6_9BACT|nr:glutamate--tRNA ligase [Abditibacterium utsteinense]PQV63658.1 glutamyl-tRNA synthetase/nondiscriminating glutamyl-tRNA synthetase [Abditibacterium utsteinense]
MNSKPLRVRMAPSPTGLFHVGSARTALFNFLFARHSGAAFVLRIEDTDAARGSLEYEQVIYDAMAWLGLETDESPQQGGAFGPYRQSERFDIYKAHAAQLLESGHAYTAYETPEELTQMRELQAQNKQPPRYNGAHRELTSTQRAEFESQGRRGVLRLKIPAGKVTFGDAVYGEISWKNSDIDDFVICKSDGGPTYNFACAVDDHLMQISHVIRGEDGLSNTPRQCLIYDAFGWERPIFAHLPFLLGKDRKKLSKRNADTVSLLDFSQILPDAMFNYLTQLGWNPGSGETQEIFSRAELIEKFTLDGVNKAGAIFDAEKLNWMNIAYLKAMPIDEFLILAAPHLESLEDDLNENPEYGRAALEMARERIQSLPDIARTATYFFTDEFPVDEAGRAKHLTPENLANAAKLRERFAALEEWNSQKIEAEVRALSEELGVKVALLVHPTRMVVSGQTVGPSLWELLEFLGKERTVRRMAQ